MQNLCQNILLTSKLVLYLFSLPLHREPMRMLSGLAGIRCFLAAPYAQLSISHRAEQLLLNFMNHMFRAAL